MTTDTLEHIAPPQTTGFKPAAQGSLKAEDLIPHEYLLRIGSQRCRCGATFMFNELLLVYIHPQLTATTGFRKLVPADTIAMGHLRVGTSFLVERQIPICVECLGDRTPAGPSAPRISDAQWARTLKEDAQARRLREAREARASSTPTAPRIDIKALEL